MWRFLSMKFMRRMRNCEHAAISPFSSSAVLSMAGSYVSEK